jgi:hypothetical protein
MFSFHCKNPGPEGKVLPAEKSYVKASESLRYYLNLAPTIYCGLKRLATILGAKFRYE